MWFVLSGPPVDGPKDPWPRVLSLPGRFVWDPASLARDNILLITQINNNPSEGSLFSINLKLPHIAITDNEIKIYILSVFCKDIRIDGVSFMVERVIIVTQIMGHSLCNNREQS